MPWQVRKLEQMSLKVSENVALASGSSRLGAAGVGAVDGELASSSMPTAAVLTSRFERTGVVLLSLSFKQLALAGLTSNRGLLLVPIAIGAIYESRNLTGLQNLAVPFRDRLRIRTEDIYEMVPNGMPSVYLVLMLLGGLAVAFALLKLFSIAWFVIRFYGYELKLIGNDLRIGCGLLTKVSATVPRARIQFISIHRSWLGRKLGLASIRIETAGGGGNENENASQSVARRWFVPVLWESQVAGLIEQLRPGIHWTESQFDWRTTLSSGSDSHQTIRNLSRDFVDAGCGLYMAILGRCHWFSSFADIFVGCMAHG